MDEYVFSTLSQTTLQKLPLLSKRHSCAKSKLCLNTRLHVSRQCFIWMFTPNYLSQFVLCSYPHVRDMHSNKYLPKLTRGSTRLEPKSRKLFTCYFLPVLNTMFSEVKLGGELEMFGHRSETFRRHCRMKFPIHIQHPPNTPNEQIHCKEPLLRS